MSIVCEGPLPRRPHEKGFTAEGRLALRRSSPGRLGQYPVVCHCHSNIILLCRWSAILERRAFHPVFPL